MERVILPGVFHPRSDTWMLRDRLLEEDLQGARVLEVCTGPGAIALAAARHGARVTAIDIGWLAVLSTRINAARERLDVEVLRGDLFEPVANRRFDVIVSNPPYVPSDRTRRSRVAPSRAWDGGQDGREVMDRLIAEVPDHLAPGGRCLLVHSSLNDAQRTLDELERVGLRPEIVERREGPLGPLMREWMEKQADGPAREDLVVVRAETPV